MAVSYPFSPWPYRHRNAPFPSTRTVQATCKLHDISEQGRVYLGAGELGGRCCTCSEWGRRARIAFLMSNRSLLGRSDGSATITPASLYHHSHQRLTGDYNASLCECHAQGDELVWSVRQKHPPGVSLGGLRTSYDFLLSVVLRWDAAIS